ncbi:hypothetical protein [Streptomyces sp. NPDC048200]|uniref:hypothetical protein n=1 Tax=Streptomyces sp. NPDC048200 TaxID=3365512 RepID=UPI003711F3B4
MTQYTRPAQLPPRAQLPRHPQQAASLSPRPQRSAPSPVPRPRPSRAQLTGLDRPPGGDAPPTCAVPLFAPVHVRGGRYRLRRLVRHRRRAIAAGLAMTAAALVAAGPQDAEGVRGHPAPARPAGSVAASADGSDPARARGTRPVRIADGATVGLLRPGDRVDVVAADGRGAVRVVATGARVTEVPDVGGTETGALVVLAVPRPTAVRLVGAGTTSRLAVTLR